MSCKRTQKRLSAERVGAPERRHLAACVKCAAFAARLEATVEALAGHRTVVRPDAAFASRVVASLPPPTPVLGWAAVRLLPAATALVLVLTAWVWVATESPSELVTAGPTDDVVSWVLANGGGE